MTIHTTRIRPDICNCIIDYIWDDTQSEDTRVHQVTDVVKCTVHQGLGTNQEVYDVVYTEMPRKNYAIQEILDRAPSTVWELSEDGVTRRFRRGIGVNFSFSGTVPDRVITLTVTGVTLNTSQRNNIQTSLNNRFGAGRVLLG